MNRKEKKKEALRKSFYYQLNTPEIETVRDFVEDTYSTIYAGRYNSKEMRSPEEIRSNICMGKISEIGVSHLFQSQLGIKTEVDFDVYEGSKGDEQDFPINGFVVESKSCKHSSYKLLVDVDDIMVKELKGKKPDYFILTFVYFNKEEKKPYPNLWVYGYCDFNTLVNSELLKPGAMIPGTNQPVHNLVYCLDYEELETDWSKLGEILKEGKRVNGAVK